MNIIPHQKIQKNQTSDKTTALYILLVMSVILISFARPNTLIIGNILININTIIAAFTSVLAITAIHIVTKKQYHNKNTHHLRKITTLAIGVIVLISAGYVMVEQKNQNNAITKIQYGKLGQITKLTLYAKKNEATFYTNAKINEKNIKFLIDTGASFISLKWEDARNIGINTDKLNFNIKTNTANGNAKAAFVTIKKISINNIVVHNLKALVKPKNTQKISLLGMNFLKKIHEVRIKGNTLTLIEKIS